MTKNELQVLEELKKQEPIFHQEELCDTEEKLEKYCVPDYWEVGASGKVYDKEFIFTTVLDRFRKGTEPDTSKWSASDFACRQLANDTYLLTYRLTQEDRDTRRSTIWKRARDGWLVVYHQGTVIE